MQEYTIQELQEKMTSGELTARQIAEGYLNRIVSVDKIINSIIEMNPDAIAIASSARSR